MFTTKLNSNFKYYVGFILKFPLLSLLIMVYIDLILKNSEFVSKLATLLVKKLKMFNFIVKLSLLAAKSYDCRIGRLFRNVQGNI